MSEQRTWKHVQSKNYISVGVNWDTLNTLITQQKCISKY